MSYEPKADGSNPKAGSLIMWIRASLFARAEESPDSK